MPLSTRKIGNDSELEKILNRHLCKLRSYYVEVGPKKIILPSQMTTILERIERLNVRDDDVYIFGFLKSGTRLTQELVWLLMNDFDFETAKKFGLEDRVPLVELEGFYDELPAPVRELRNVDELKDPRCMKSHLQWDLLPEAIKCGKKEPKMIVVMRGPEDVCTSYYHQCKAELYSGTFEEFCALFLGGKIPFGPYWEHVLGFWEQRHRPNIMYLKYHEMISDMAGTIRNVAKFLGRTLTDDNVAAMCAYLKFDNLKKIESFNCNTLYKDVVNPFIRKGITGDHKNFMSNKIVEEFQMQRKRYLSGTNLTLI